MQAAHNRHPSSRDGHLSPDKHLPSGRHPPRLGGHRRLQTRFHPRKARRRRLRSRRARRSRSERASPR
eukprot:16451137-Heterocapsa_arctica.AAC.1